MTDSLVGYKLIGPDGSTVQEFGGIWGQCPGVPNPLILPNGDQVLAASVGDDYGGYHLEGWYMDPPVLGPADFPLSPKQIRLGLTRDANLSLSSIQSTIDSTADPAERDELQIYWEFSSVYLWGDVDVQSLFSELDMDQDQATSTWMAAKEYPS